MLRLYLIVLIAVVPLSGMVVVDALQAVQTVDSVDAADDFSKQFKITTKRSDDKVDLYPSVDKGSIAIFSIRSPFGISNATIERIESNWKQPIVIRLHLKGLENLQITNGKTTLEASVSSHDEKSRVRFWKDKDEDKLLDSTSPYWMEIRMMDRDEKLTNAIPLIDGYFEMQLPKAMFEDNPKSITISWIDFYR